MSDEKKIDQSISQAHNAATSGTGDATVNNITTNIYNAIPSKSQNPQQLPLDIDELVQTTRVNIRDRIIYKHGKMSVLDMGRPMEIGNIYTNVNVLEKITANQYLSISEMEEKDLDASRNGNVIAAEVPADGVVESEPKLMILGKPGAGKTIFLWHLMLKCIEGEMLQTHIPLFIELKDFEHGRVKLFDYIAERLVEYGVEETQVEPLLNSGRLFILLDGLDEVQGDKQISPKIKKFTDKYFKNRFVITCRIAAQEFNFEQFTNVEITDFDDKQIEQFVRQWFAARKDTNEAESFILHLDGNDKLKELAKTALLLTLLCLVFEQKGEFPLSRVQLYEQYLGVFLEKWDKSRAVERDQPLYVPPLLYKEKEELLCEIAYSTFVRDKYFFTPSEVDECIKQYFDKTFVESTSVQFTSENVLKLIESQHGLIIEAATGIYCFSHLTFHEYLTAKKIFAEGKELLFATADYITETRWYEVLLSMVGILHNPDSLLQSMKQEIDGLLKDDGKLQQYLAWVKDTLNLVEFKFKPAGVRALYLDRDLFLFVSHYFDHSLSLHLDLSRHLDLDLSQHLDLSRHLDLNLSQSLDLSRHLDLNLSQSLYRIKGFAGKNEFKRKLLFLKNQLSSRMQIEDYDTFKQWWKENGDKWTQQLREIMIEHRNIGHDWQFTNHQKQLLAKYYDANKLLVDCLNSDCRVTPDVRKPIEDTMILPIKSIPPTHLKTVLLQL